MKKELYFKLDTAQCDWAFKAIRQKSDVIEILMRAIKTMLIYEEPRKEDVAGILKLHVEKMNRIFFFSKDKYYSIAFPFSVEEVEGRCVFRSKDVDDINSQLTSHVISILNDESFRNESNIYSFLDPLLDVVEGKDMPFFWPFFKALLTYEDGYIRYDVDHERCNGKLHPLYHFDIFYSNNTTFKVGCNVHYSDESMIDVLNIKTDCHFINN
ncbi:hypothetical protein ACSJM2_12640 [Serratia marcescens]|uniref:Uncharacterized protein n=1 Tax=Serratia ureilytica TaxID=300181 RepID=A0ABU0VPU7_9GAMM|nr:MULTISPECIES: hypothetical protein [Serratia]ASM23968.1 hypothetical protein BVG92_21845 [Serratia marcescens]ASM28745.1 hypothetical protein BVG89_21845 [Serratia marcescens]MBN5239049.1 hypothetical protein [Serratia marcescens]MBN5346193.1 hypothetical protein [Serratia marcescens]MCU7063110.1 hypothetical protein [Serratia ureilytica]